MHDSVQLTDAAWRCLVTGLLGPAVALAVQSSLPLPDIQPIARLRSFHPYLLLLSSVVIVAGIAAVVYAGIMYAHTARAVLFIFLIPAGIYGAARIFLPIELTADENEIRWKEPFRSAQVVRRRDVARIEQRVKRNSSYAYFVDQDGKDLLFVGPIFSPAQMESFATSVALPIRGVAAEPPRSTRLDALQKRSAAQGNRAYALMFFGLLVLLAVAIWIFAGVTMIQSNQSFGAYRIAPTCVSPPTPGQDCRYQASGVVSHLHTNKYGNPAMTLTFATDVFSGSQPRQQDVSLMTYTGPTLEPGMTVQVEVWRRDLVTHVNGTETTNFDTLKSNSNLLLLVAVTLMVPVPALAFFIWQWRSRPR